MSDVSTRRATVTPSGGGSVLDTLETGQWFWYSGKNYDGSKFRQLSCVVHIGSNHAELHSPCDGGGTHEWRVHFDKFSDVCEYEPDAEAKIRGLVAEHRQEAARLMAEVQELTIRLAIAPRAGLPDGTDTGSMALALHAGKPVKSYRMELEKAKDKTLPEMFKAIEKETQAMSQWMKASLLPLRAQVEGMKPAIEAIESRIHNVELYAGLSEQVERIQDGAPAGIAEQLRLFQRRHYMDEECLAQYESGGMSFKDIGAFDRWLLRADNLSRLLPFPRCIVAFRVRRLEKEREDVDLSAFVRIALKQADETTFLYIRNGEQVFRLSTAIDFGTRLFPDLNRSQLDGVVYAKYFTGVDDELIGQGEFEGLLEAHVGHADSWDNRPATKKERAERLLFARKQDAAGEPVRLNFYSWVRWSPDSVHYDDISDVVRKQVEQHNRIVTVLQGLLDRSQVLHPHPAWQLWTPEGFAAGVQLVYDDSRGLTSGEKPDFEAYRAHLNATLAEGCHTVGQEDYWLRKEAEKENARVHASLRESPRGWREHARYKPYDDDGPGMVAQVATVTKSGCSFRWIKNRQKRGRWNQRSEDVARSIRVPCGKLLNVSAYVPGDFRQFYADPRTRSDYLQWAPLLLTAEDWHAKNKGEVAQ